MLTIVFVVAAWATPSAPADPDTTAAGAANPMAALSRQVQQIAAKAAPSIVRIEVDTPLPAGAPQGVVVITRRRISTGFVAAEGGFVLTTAETVRSYAQWLVPGPAGGMHRLVEIAKTAEIIDASGRRRPARVVATCPRSNLALLQADNLHARPLELGDSTTLTPGCLVVTCSAPGLPGARLGLGLVNQTHVRSGAYQVEDLISLSLPVGGGATGSPVFSAEGTVVGMIAAAQPVWQVPRTLPGGWGALPFPDLSGEGWPLDREPAAPGGISEAMGLRAAGEAVLAIPSSFLARALPDLKTAGRVLYGYLGVQIRQDGEAVLVGPVVAESPALRAGLREGDRLLSLDGEPIGRVHDFQRQIMHRRPSERITLGWKRGPTLMSAQIVLGRRPESDPASAAGPQTEDPFERLRSRLLQLPTPQRLDLERQLREHLHRMQELLRQQTRQLERQLEQVENLPATMPADPD